MDQVEGDLAKLLKGAALDENDSLCDFTVADQNEASGEYRTDFFTFLGYVICDVWF